MSQYNTIKDTVISVSRELVDKGFLMGTGGNVSIRIPGENLMAITPSNFDYMAMTTDDICIIDWQLAVKEGERKPSIESGMHAAVYQTRQDISAVIHTHQVFASAISLMKRPIPALFDEQVRFLGRSVDVVPYAPSGTGWLKSAIVRSVKNNYNAFILQNHGALILGDSPERAISNVEVLEKCATAFLLAYFTDERVTKIPLPIREIIFAKLRKEQRATSLADSSTKNQSEE
jgi:ribulose-5-phosphate 4-epimerase/fuculose-1-phosphate aldolase